jgi:hypothetical protein
MDRQARTDDAVLVKSREMIGRNHTEYCGGGEGRRGKDDKKTKCFGPVGLNI